MEAEFELSDVLFFSFIVAALVFWLTFICTSGLWNESWKRELVARGVAEYRIGPTGSVGWYWVDEQNREDE